MIHLFVIADDFTGALDTGVQFASYGAATKVVVGTGLQALEADAQTQVLVVDAETRHLPAAQAYDTVYRLVRWAKEKKIGCIYKKTDSALRGNIGAELSAALAADGGDRLHFVPAFPNLDRVTRGGVHYIGGVPVAQSVFGKDPFEPVTHSRVEDILHEQTDTLCAYIPGGGSAEGKAGVLVYEAQTNRDMAQIADQLAARSETGLLAGCAGEKGIIDRDGYQLDTRHPAQAAYPRIKGLLQLSCRDTAPLPLCGRLLAVCGSINPVSLEQCAQAEAQGAPRFSLTPEQKLSRDWAAGAQAGEMLGAVLRACSQEPVVVLDTGGAVENAGADKTADRIQIANTLGALLKRLLDDGLESTVLIMGGDCLLGLMRQLDVTEIMPLCEVAPGVVLSQFTYGGRQWNLVSKSGGFGAKTLFYDLQNILERWKKELPAV